MKPSNQLTPERIMAGAERLAEASAEALKWALSDAATLPTVRSIAEAQGVDVITLVDRECQNRKAWVIDSYLTGAEEMLKALHGDFAPEQWRDGFNHAERLAELFDRFKLRAGAPPWYFQFHERMSQLYRRRKNQPE